MPRTDETLVRATVQTVASIDVTPFIAFANTLTNQLANQDTDGVLTTDDLQAIETYLAAHFYSQRDQAYQSRSTMGASGTFQGQTGMILENTIYGQQAMMLDATNYLARRNEEVKTGQKRVAGVVWLGTDDE